MPHTLAQLEAFVSSAHYDADTADLIAQGIPALKATGAPGELISPGVRRIHGNLCNVHGRYGPCDAALSGKKPPKGRPRKPAKPKVDRAAQHAQNRTQTLTSQGYSADDQAALSALHSGAQPANVSQGLIDKGLVEQAQDGTYRMTASGRALVTAADQGNAGRARDTASGAADRLSARRARQAEQAKRQQDAVGKRTANQIGRELTRRQRADAAAKRRAEAAKKPAKASAGGSKKPEKTPVEKPFKPSKRIARSQAPAAPALSSSPAKPKPNAPAKQIAPALSEAAQQLSDGAEISEADTQALIRNGLARLVKGELVLTAAGQRLTMKEYSFRVFKDAQGRHRWVAQSSTAFQDRDREIVSTKALEDDCQWADTHENAYGPLRWWHTPGLDLGDCDFNAMHGRVLIESGTFRSATIAQKVAAAAPGLEISLGFIHLPTEPDADGVFHHIRRFERSLVPRGKASNRFTAFTVKETRMPNKFTPEKIEQLKAIGFSDEEIVAFSNNATATEKTADGMLIASKADEPESPLVYAAPDGTQGIIQDGRFVALKAFPAADAPPDTAAEDTMDGGADDAMEAPMDENALTLSAGDLAAIGEAISAGIAQVMGALDLEKKVAGHVQGLMAPYQATKDASDAEKAEQIAQLQTALKDTQVKIAELTGDQPAAQYRPSQANNNVLTDAAMLAAAKQALDPNAADPWADIKLGLGLTRPQ